jgi:uncharacterized protein (TIGR02646 family)
MRAITKQPEPRSLAQHRATAHTDYDNYADKDTLRAQLVQEQRGLCCFCCGRIVADESKMKIVHWMPRQPFPEHQLDYWNLLGACLGNEGQMKARQHCDTHQGNARLSRNPANPDHQIENFVKFLPDGSITSDDPTLENELGKKKRDGTFEEGVLNLNLPFLQKSRMEKLSAFTKGLGKRGELSRPTLLNLFRIGMAIPLESLSPMRQ